MFSRIVEIFSLIRRCKRDWPNHSKTGGRGGGGGGGGGGVYYSLMVK